MKKIVIIHHSSIIGGAANSLYNQIKLLQNRYEVTIYVSNFRSDFSDFLLKNGVNVKHYNGRIGAIYSHASGGGVCSLGFWYRLWRIFKQYNYWTKIIKNENADLYVVNSVVLCWFSILFNKLNKRCLCNVRETFKNEGKGIINTLIIKQLSTFDAVSFISDYDRGIASIDLKTRVFTNNNSYFYELSDMECSSRDDGNLNILYLGGYSKLKGICLLIDAAKELENHKRDIHYYVLGDHYSKGKNSEFATKIAAKIESDPFLKDCFHLIGLQTDISKYFLHSDILVCPITKPHQLRPIFEAGCFSKGVIVPRFTQLEWAVTDNENGIFFEPCSARDLADKILHLFNNRDDLHRLGENNRIRYLLNHSPEVCDKKILTMYSEILKKDEK